MPYADLDAETVGLVPALRPITLHCTCVLQAGSIFVMTHDSIGLGEDGPTHQPVEHLASFRAMPNINMLRPGDGTETAGAYKASPASPSLQGHCFDTRA